MISFRITNSEFPVGGTEVPVSVWIFDLNALDVAFFRKYRVFPTGKLTYVPVPVVAGDMFDELEYS